MDPATYLDYLRSDAEALAGAAQRSPSASIASCPDWDMSGLLAHVGGVHRWVEHIVSTKSAAYVKLQSPAPDGPEATLDWYHDGVARLLATLGATDPDEGVWNWLDRAPAPARFWFRRMAHETAIHRWDGEAAAAGQGGAVEAGEAGAGVPRPIAAELAVDGIDEFLGFVSLWLAREPVPGFGGSLHLHATDTDGEWSLDLGPDRLEHRREHAKADAALRGPVSDLLLWMLNRVPADSPTLAVFGDSAIVERWRQLKF